MYKYLLLIFLLTWFAIPAKAQAPEFNKETKKDSINQRSDSVTQKRFAPKVKHDNRLYHPDSTHDPHKAIIRSLIVPGWGQLYNNQWWKVPIIYAGLGLLVDAIIFNEHNYAPNLVVAHYYEEGQTLSGPGSLPTTAKDYLLFQEYTDYGVTATQVDGFVDSYRRDRDLSIIGFLGAWGIQVLDAYIDAKFKQSYTMDEDFSFKVEPTILNQQPIYSFASGPIIPGLKLTFAIR
jgi:hypothetical protein